MTNKISVIVPVYNIEKYIQQCIESIVNQTYKNLEIILVDDGSTDNSGKLCDDYAAQDQRIRVIHKENGGLSDARNAGLETCTGDFISFIDGDDWIELNMYEIMLEHINKNYCDIVSCGYNVRYKNKNYKVYSSNKIIDKCDIIRCYYAENNVFYGTCMRLYKKYIWKDLRFPKGKIYEDVFVFLDSFLKSNRIMIVSDCLYNYRQRKSSIMGRNFDKRQLNLIDGHKKNLIFISKNYPQYISKAKKELLLGEKDILLKAINSLAQDDFTINVKIKIQNDIRNNIKFIVFSELFSIKSKVALILAALNLNIYAICMNFKRNKNCIYYS